MPDNPYLRAQRGRENPYRKAMQAGSVASQHLSALIPVRVDTEAPPRRYQSALDASPGLGDRNEKDRVAATKPLDPAQQPPQGPQAKYESAGGRRSLRTSAYRRASEPEETKPTSRPTPAPSATPKGTGGFANPAPAEPDIRQQPLQQGSTAAESLQQDAVAASAPKTPQQPSLERQAQEFLRKLEERDPFEGERRWFEELAAAHYPNRLEAAMEFIQAASQDL